MNIRDADITHGDIARIGHTVSICDGLTFNQTRRHIRRLIKSKSRTCGFGRYRLVCRYRIKNPCGRGRRQRGRIINRDTRIDVVLGHNISCAKAAAFSRSQARNRDR